jgi:hypothetical protein
MRVFFAMELCIELMPGREGLVQRLHAYTTAQASGASRKEKSRFYIDLSTSLLNEQPAWRRGIWDYSDDDTEARRMFNDYASVLGTKKGARQSPSQGHPTRDLGGPFFVNLTFAWMLAANSTSAMMLEGGKLLAQAGLWQRQTFANLLRLVPRVVPSEIESDVVYVIPGDLRFALTADDLASTDYTYLRRIED